MPSASVALPDLTPVFQGSLRDWLQTVATFAAVFVALWVQWIRVVRRRPRLTLGFDSSEGSPNYSPIYIASWPDAVKEKDRYQALWLRCSVTNAHNKDTATDVEVLVTGVVRPVGDPRRGVTPSRPLKWSDIIAGRISLPPGVTRYVDLGWIRAPRKNAPRVVMTLELEPPAPDDPRDDRQDPRRQFGAGCVKFEVAVTAANIKAARFYTITLQLDDAYEEDPADLARHARILVREGRVNRGARS
jgi:hypothetical protein